MSAETGSAEKQQAVDSRAADTATGKKPRKIKFQIAAEPESKVYLAGTFNDWDPIAIRMRRNGNGTFAATLLLPQGRHEYKFVVNGTWQMDPNCPQWTPNSLGSLNSVVEVA